jgi:hypothetical protein
LGITAQIKDYDAIKDQLEEMKKASRTVLERTVSDAKKRIPPWVAGEVSKQYGIKKAEIGSGSAGKIRIEGNSIETLKLIYTGRVLTPTHFGMTPKAPGVNAYTLKAQIIRGQKATLGKVKKLSKAQRVELAKNFRREGAQSSSHSPIMLMGTGNTKAAGTNYIPFQRKSSIRSDVEAIKTISVPQMVSSERSAPGITKAINEGLQKRLDHHFGRVMGK